MTASDQEARRSGDVTSLLVCRESPYPPDSGAPLRMWQHVNTLASLGDVHVFSIGELDDRPHEMPIAKSWQHFDPRSLPEARENVIARIYRVLRPPEYPVRGRKANNELDSALRELVDRVKPDVAIVSHWRTAYPTALRSVPHVVVDAHNIEWKLRADGAFPMAFKRFRRFKLWHFKRREKRLYESADSVWVTGEPDREVLKRFAPRSTSKIVPNALDTDSFTRMHDRIAESPIDEEFSVPTMIFVGFLSYKPNEAAAYTLIDEVLPIVAGRFPDARLMIVGRSPSPELRNRAETAKNVTLASDVPDVKPYLMSATVAVMPLQIGGGTRLKILEAFASSVPIVSTSKGAEGISQRGLESLILAENSKAIADAVISLMENRDLRNDLVHRALSVVEDEYSWKSVARRLPAALT